MGSEVFQWVIAIAVLVVFIVNIVVLTLIYIMLKPLIAKLKKASDHVNPILGDMQRIISDNRDKITATVSESQPAVRDIMVKANDIAGAVRGILNQAHGIMSDNRETINNTISESKPLVRDILTRTNNIAATVHGILNDAQPVVHDIGTKANDIAGAARDVALTVKSQVERLDGLVRNVNGKIDETASIVQSRVIEPVATKAGDITDLARAQVIEIGGLVRDTALTLKNQAERLDELVRHTMDKIDSATTTVQKGVTEPIREINYIGVAIKRAISALFNNRGGKTVS